MKNPITANSWKTILPTPCAWLEAVKITTKSDSYTGKQVVVAVSSTGDKDSSDFNIDAPSLSKESHASVKKHAQASGWTTSDGVERFYVDGTSWILVPENTLKVTEQQKARKIGMDAAGLCKNTAALTIAGGEKRCAGDIFEGLVSNLYKMDAFKGKAPTATKLPSEVEFACDMSEDKVAVHRAQAEAQIVCRFLQDAPPNYLNSESLADFVSGMAKDLNLKFEAKGRNEIKELGMGAFASVAAASSFDPKLIVVEISGKDSSKTTALVGKGLTFDAGGISIKPSAGMDEMKYDMSGAASVLGSAYFLGKVQPPTNVVCVVGATENVISSDATRPGDVCTAMNGKTIEVLNTDAEGRLVLADALYWTSKEYNPDWIIDVATLTGAVLVALGVSGSALMANDEKTGAFVLDAAKKQSEPFWELPLWPDIANETAGKVGDLKNIAAPSVKAGTIMAGHFLSEFVGDSKWVHLDIAGTAWNCKTVGYPTSGGSGFGVRTMTQACMSHES